MDMQEGNSRRKEKTLKRKETKVKKEAMNYYLFLRGDGMLNDGNGQQKDRRKIMDSE